MKEIVELISNPLVLKLLAGYWLFSAIVSAMEAPTSTSNKGYIFAFRLGHALQGNLNRAAMALHVPGADDKA